MKKIFFAALFTCILIVFGAPLKAQLQVSLNVNIGSQPIWGPVGYDEVQYYYLPDIDAYYSVTQHRFYYDEDGKWINRSSLPPRFHKYDLYHGYKVVVNEREPWKRNETYRAKYSEFRGRKDQPVIRDSREPKYFVNKNHPEHKNWVKQQKQAVGPEKKPIHPSPQMNNNRGAKPAQQIQPGKKPQNDKMIKPLRQTPGNNKAKPPARQENHDTKGNSDRHDDRKK